MPLTLTDNVISWFAEVSKLPAGSVDPDEDLFVHYGLDSVDALKLISDIEVKFDIDIEEEEAQQIRTLNDAIALINLKLEAKQADD